MVQLYFSYEPRHHVSGKASIHIDESELAPVAKHLLEGAGEHLGQVCHEAWAWFDLKNGDFAALDSIDRSTWKRCKEGEPFRIIENGTRAECMNTLEDFLTGSLMWSKIALDHLCSERYGEFVRALAISINFFTTFSVVLGIINADEEGGQATIEKAVMAKHLKAASEAAAKRHREIKEEALQMYRMGNFKSKNRAAEILAPKIGRTVAVVRGWLTKV